MASYRFWRRSLVVVTYGSIATFAIINMLGDRSWDAIEKNILIETLVICIPLYIVLRQMRKTKFAFYQDSQRYNPQPQATPTTATRTGRVLGIVAGTSRFIKVIFVVIALGALIYVVGVIIHDNHFIYINIMGILLVLFGVVLTGVYIFRYQKAVGRIARSALNMFIQGTDFKEITSAEGEMFIQPFVRNLFRECNINKARYQFRSLDGFLHFGFASLSHRSSMTSRDSYEELIGYWAYNMAPGTSRQFCIMPSDHRLPAVFHNAVGTESVEFNNLASVYTQNDQPSGDVLAPDIMAMYLDAKIHPWLLCTQSKLLMIIEEPVITMESLQNAYDLFTKFQHHFSEEGVIQPIRVPT